LTFAFDCGSGYGAFGAATSVSCPTSAVGALEVGVKVSDDDGGVTEYRATVQVLVTYDSLRALVAQLVDKPGVADALLAKLDAAQAAAAGGDENAEQGILEAFVNQVEAQAGKAMTEEEAALLIRLVRAL
jgi:hypothetical protein